MKIIMIFLLFVMAFIIWSAIFYQLFGWGKNFYHNLLDWHIPIKKETRIEGYTETSICKYCKKPIMKNPQGNWFRYQKEKKDN